MYNSSLFGDHPATRPLSDADVQFLDTTLRDGEQAPGVSLSPEQKADIARELDAAGVDVIEAGSACTGPGERETIKRVTDLGLDAKVTSFARGVRNDIDLALDCDVDGVTLVVPSSDRHVETKVGTTREDVVATVEELVEYATDHGLWIEALGEDGSRADLAFLERLAEAAHDAGADRFCYADTVGHATPDRTLEVVAALSEYGATSTHTHDDLGLGVMNALVSVAAGADLVHGTINGVGERAGNVALEEVAIALDHGYGVETLTLERVYDLGRMVAEGTGIPLAPNKAVLGENAFTHESGIHTDGTLKDDAMYEPYPPEKVGRERRLVLGKHAGRAGVEAALNEHGVEVDEDELTEILTRVKKLGDRGKRVTDADLLTFAEEVQGRERDRRVELVDLTAAAGGSTPTASVRLRIDGEERTAAATGDGPVDAAVTAARRALGSAGDASLDSYHVDAITGGTDAVVTVEVEMSRGDRSVTVTASDADITTASVRAMVDAMDRLLAQTPDQVLADD
ncbi:(R)-citramalate synthase [Halorarius litoreus]|uniref:(R)-citramalate synthase n=1 Tax=Halorarius litoreus TaxID=2962676 RepID=UPI0020CE42A9|nr:(R)-citramalate synthase [Halorarius litoreus]